MAGRHTDCRRYWRGIFAAGIDLASAGVEDEMLG